MSHIIESRRSKHQIRGLLSALLAASILLPNTNTPTEPISVSVAPSVQSVQSREVSCPIPANVIVPGIKALSRDIAKRFHLAESAALIITHAAFSAARVQGIDPMLVLAVTAVESKFKPRAVNPASGAKGLMQVLPRWHQHKVLDVGGESSLLLIAPNINVGSAILAEYLTAEDGDIEGALGHYLGSVGADHYVHQVRREMAHMTRVVNAT